MSVICPRCGATGTQSCTTVRGNDHAARIRAEIATLQAKAPALVITQIERATRSIYEHAGVPEGDKGALHATGHTSWDCTQCGNDPEDCDGHESSGPAREHTDACDAWADMNGSGCTCHVEDESTDSALRYHEMTPDEVLAEAELESEGIAT